MKFLSKDWFKSKIEQAVISVTEKTVTSKISKIMEEIENEDDVEDIPPYKNLIYINNTLTIIFHDNEMLTYEVTEDIVDKVKNAKTRQEVLSLVTSKERREEILKSMEIANKFDILIESGEFTSDGGCIYMKGIKRSLPELLINKFYEILTEIKEDDEFEEGENWQDSLANNEIFNSYKRFWQKCCLNPNAKSAEDLYGFLQKHNFKIDKHGNFYAYRRVESKGNENKELVEFVSNTYTKVKAIWKKSPKSYTVGKDSDGEYSIYLNSASKNWESIGNLEELYLDLPNMKENSYTSNYTGKENYRIGEVISMPRHEGDDDNTRACSRGFHGAEPTLYSYASFGDKVALMIVNPIDILAIPESGKFRCCRWFFAAVLDENEDRIVDDDDFHVTDLGDVFESKCLENLEEHVREAYAEEVQRHTFDVTNISTEEISDICKDLSKIQKEINSRVQSI